ncbi:MULTISPECIES: hypothetical protein [Streptomyces]|uniref:hypothetical protein n=1 Tax=Streptomyces TaxID=1883 RepID=UPI000A89321A|nr:MULTISPECIES: hypothetical protein [Streptomyces]
MHRMTSTLDVPRAGLVDDMTEDDNGRGYERDETDTAFRQLVDHLVADGRPTAGTRGAPRASGFFSTQLLFLTGQRTCRAGVLPVRQNTLQCDQCGGRFGFLPGSLWTCPACQALGR